MMGKFLNLAFLSLFLAACSSSHGQGHDAIKYSLAVSMQNKARENKSELIANTVVAAPVSLESKKRLSGEEAIRVANKKALREPNSTEYINATMIFDYMPGALYQIYCAPLSITDLQFQANEHIIAVGAGDTARWQVSKTFSGVGGEREEHLLLKPVDEDLQNGLVVTTDRRTYHLLLNSKAKTYMAAVMWRYSDSGSILINNNVDANYPGNYDLNNIDMSKLDINYRIKLVGGKKMPDWLPEMIFDDGNKTYIKFPEKMQEAPILFVGGDAANNQLVNYRVQGDYYIVDRLFTEAQLRSGSDSSQQLIVQLTHMRK